MNSSMKKVKITGFHVRDPFNYNKQRALCSNEIDIHCEFHFVSIDHLYMTMEQDGLQMPCPACLRKIKEIFTYKKRKKDYVQYREDIMNRDI